MSNQQIDKSNLYIACDQPTHCPLCGARTEVLLDFSHTFNQVQAHKCLDDNCAFEFFEVADEAEIYPKIKLFYLYRDAGNYKTFHSIVIANPDNIPLEEVEATIRTHLIDGEFFNPKAWEMPKPEFEDVDMDLDHDWCEFEKLELTDEIADVDVTISELLYMIENNASSNS